jgi:hypothetical protein
MASHRAGSEIAAVRHAFARLQARIHLIKALEEIMMTEFDDLSTDADDLGTAVGALADGYIALRDANAGLAAQIAAAPPGPSTDQMTTLHAKYVAIEQRIADALAPVVTVPPTAAPTA